MPPLPILLTAAADDDRLGPLEGIPTPLIIGFFVFVLAIYVWNGRQRREAAHRHMTRDDWQTELRANDPDMAKPDDAQEAG